MRKVYKGLSLYNNGKALLKGRIWQRIWNKTVMKMARKLFK